MRCAARSRKLSHSLHAGGVASGKADVATTSSGVCRRHARGSVASRNADVGWGLPHRWPSALRIAIHRMRLSVNGYNAAAWAAFFLQPRNHIILWTFTQTLWICRHRRVNIPENRMILDRARRRAYCFAASWRQPFFCAIFLNLQQKYPFPAGHSPTRRAIMRYGKM